MTLIDVFRSYLSTRDCMVVFTKKNGEERTMYCTTRPEFLAELEVQPVIKDSTEPVKKSETTVCAYDTEKNGWRSFNLDSVKEFYTLEEDGDYYLVYEDIEKLKEDAGV